MKELIFTYFVIKYVLSKSQYLLCKFKIYIFIYYFPYLQFTYEFFVIYVVDKY